jgi:quinol monooxygenase YgiN
VSDSFTVRIETEEGAMTVLVTMHGPVSDWDSFKGALDWYAGEDRAAGLHWSRSYRQEGDQNHVLLVEEWDDHDAYHKASDEIGEEFGTRAKADFSGWTTDVWTQSDAPTVESDGVRSTLVWMTVSPPDWEAFKGAVAWIAGMERPKGLHSTQTFRREGNPSLVLDLEEWDNHDAFHETSEKVGDEFNKRAKTEGLDWETFIWEPSGAKVIA